MADPLDQILEPSYLGGLRGRPIEQVRSMRDLCQQVESALSYVRRLAHARLDIAGGELARRRSGGDPGAVGDLVERLPELLADPVTERRRMPRSPRRVEAGEPPVELESELDGIVGADDLVGIGDLSDTELERMADDLVTFERTISDRRHRVHERIDTLQAEIARRYRDGEVDIASVLE